MWNPYQISDILMNLVIIWFLFSIYKRDHWGIAGSLFLGSLLRETFLVLIPAGLIYMIVYDKRIRQIALFCGIAIITSFIPYLLRQLVPASNGDTLKSAFSVYAIYKLHTIKGVYHYFFNPWIPFSIFPLIYFRETWSFFRENSHLFILLIGVYFSGFFGINVERLVHPAFVVFYYLLTLIMMRWFESRLQIIFLTFAAFLTSFHYIIGRYPLSSRNIVIVISGSASVLATLYAFWNKLQKRKTRYVSYAGN